MPGLVGQRLRIIVEARAILTPPVWFGRKARMLALCAAPVLVLLLLWLGGLVIWWFPLAKGFSVEREIIPTFEDMRLADVLASIRPGVTPQYSSPELADAKVYFITKSAMKERDALMWIALSSQTVIIEDAGELRVEGIFWLEEFYRELDRNILLYTGMRLWPERAKRFPFRSR